MKKRLIRIFSCILALSFILLCFTGCQENSPNKTAAVAFITKVLTMPYEQISEPDPGVEMNDEEKIKKYEEKMNLAVRSLCSDYAAEKLLKSDSSFYQLIIVDHIRAVALNYTSTVESVTLDEVNEKQFQYTATLQFSNEDEPRIVNGAIQFDDDGLIDYMTAGNLPDGLN